MSLCTVCQRVDFRALLIACLQQCRGRQEAISNGEIYDYNSFPSDNSPKFRHHDDIFEVEKSSTHCNLCEIIFETFQRRERDRKAANAEEARGLEIVFHAAGSGVGVYYDTKERLIELCQLDIYMDESNVNKIFELCAIKEDDSPPVLRRMELNSGSNTALNIASIWLERCLKNHDSCKPPAELHKPPKRLINVGDESQIPFLVESSPSSQQVTWLSLSYCWGQEPSVKLSLDNLDALKRGIPLETLDRTIQDAILVSRALNIPYIWIDALCITQDDDGKDWTEQAPKMSEIYGGSVLTLVVASEESVKDGFLKERELRYIPIPRSSNQPDNFNDAGPITKVFLSPEWDKSNDHINGHWTNRGWTMQEGLLPSRLLHYTSSQMIWKCHEEIRFERGVTQCLQSAIEEVSAFSDDIAFGSGWIWKLDTFMIFKILPRYLPGNLDSRLLLEPETFRLWYNLIEEYTPRRFKNISDRLVAISGLAQVFGNMIRCREYVAGLWKPDLIRGLMWHVEGAKLVPRRSTETMRAVNADFPSWSWASIGYQRIKNSQKHSTHLQALSQIDDVQVELMDVLQPFGSVKRGSLTITGPLKKIPRLYNGELKSAGEPISKLEQYISATLEEESSGNVEDRYSSPPGGHFAVLQMLEGIDTMDLLVLEATGSKKENEYRRVGVLTLWHIPIQYAASPSAIAKMEDFENSLSARLGPPVQRGQEHKLANDVVAELRREHWMEETVIII